MAENLNSNFKILTKFSNTLKNLETYSECYVKHFGIYCNSIITVAISKIKNKSESEYKVFENI